MNLYVLSFCVAALVTALSIPVLKRTLGPRLTDVPGGLKTHAAAVPMLGGCALFLGLAASLVLVRLITNFPSGTLHYWRGVLGGGTLIFALGLLDDLRKPKGLPVSLRLGVQAAAAGLLIYYGVYVQIFSAPWLNYLLTFGWIVGLTNAFNLLDIADGLCVSQALICMTGLCLISWPGELWYVRLAALAGVGACLAFWPYNHRAPKIFLGDSGATFLGFWVAALSMGTQYSRTNPYGYVAPLFIAAVPLLDTTYVCLARCLQGKNPLKGSKDHLFLRLRERFHFPDPVILGLFALAALGCNLLAYEVTRCAPLHTQAFGTLAALAAGLVLIWLLQKLHT